VNIPSHRERPLYNPGNKARGSLPDSRKLSWLQGLISLPVETKAYRIFVFMEVNYLRVAVRFVKGAELDVFRE